MAVSYAINWNRIIWYFIPRACDITSNEWILGQQFPNERLNELFILQSNKQGFTEIAITFGEGGTCHSIGNGRDRTQSPVLLSTSSLHTAENLLWLSRLLPFFGIKNEEKKTEKVIFLMQRFQETLHHTVLYMWALKFSFAQPTP